LSVNEIGPPMAHRVLFVRNEAAIAFAKTLERIRRRDGIGRKVGR
jgi:hypothetical protein